MNNPLNRAFNVAVNHICMKVLPCGYDVSENAPNDYEALQAHYEKTGRICVWNGASENTIFACPETNYDFRAWHDARHITGQYDFSFSGEYLTAMAQCRDIVAIFDGDTATRFCRLVRAEVIGQATYKDIHGKFPEDQMQFVKDYLSNEPGLCYTSKYAI